MSHGLNQLLALTLILNHCPVSLSPHRILAVQQLRRPCSEPCKTDPAFVLDFRERIANHAVAARENGPVRSDFIEPRPQRRGGWISDGHDVTPFGQRGIAALLESQALDLRAPEQRDGGFDRIDEASVWP